MATGLLALLDDITTILDDVAVLSKVAAKKTAGIAGDDLAVNAEGLVGIDPSRELPIVGKVALGSFANKFLLVPLALVLPKAVITPLLMFGGAFLCYEGVHKVLHKHSHEEDQHHDELIAALKQGPDALAKVESDKVKQAILTDIVLSAEIVAVALGAVQDEAFKTKAIVLSVVSLGMTVAIYGLVATIVKIDDVGLHLQQTRAPSTFAHRFGKAMVDYTPALMRTISVVGTAAMFMVGGGIFLHGMHDVEVALHHFLETLTHSPTVLGALSTLATLGTGVLLGIAAVIVVEIVKRAVAVVRPGKSAAH